MNRPLKRRSFIVLAATAAGLESFSSHAAELPVGGQPQSSQATPAAAAPSPLDPRSTALLVMDYQIAWLDTLFETDDLLAHAAEAIATAREHGIPIVYARVAFTAADYAAVPEHNIIFNQIARPAGVLDEDLPRTAIDDRVAPEPADKVVRKTRVSAFDRTDLDEWLRGMNIDTLMLAGISSSGVVLSTVCDGADLDYRLLVLADACADRDPVIQDVLMEKVFPQRAQVITVVEMAELLADS